MSKERVIHMSGEANLVPEPSPQRVRRPSAVPIPAPIENEPRSIDPRENHVMSRQREVLENLCRIGVGVTPEKQAGISLTKRVRKDSTIETIAFLGPPGVGKSTAIEQFIEEMFSLAGEEISIKITSFDPAFQKMLKHTPREFWEKYHWKVINESLILTAKQKRKNIPKGRRFHPAREIHIIEVPFVGSKTTSDRGRSFVEKTWEEYKSKDEAHKMLFTSFAPMEATTKKTLTFREELAEAKTRKEQLAVLAKHGVEITEEMLKRAGKNAKELIDALIQQVLRSATRRQQEIVDQDVKKAMRMEMPNLSWSDVQGTVRFPFGINLPEDTFPLLRYVHYWDKIRQDLGISPEQWYTMINPPLSRVHRSPAKQVKKVA